MKLNKIIAMLAITVVAAGVMAQGGGGGGGRQGGRFMQFGQQLGGGDPAQLLLGGGFGGGRRGGGGGGGGGNNQLEAIEADLKLTDDQKKKISDIRDGVNTKRREMFTRNGGGGGGGGGFTPPTEEQMKEMQKLSEDAAKQVDSALNADQQKRLKQISLQLSGNRAVANKDTAKELGLSDDQNSKIADLVKKSGEAMTAIGERVRSGEIQFSEVREQMQKVNEVLQAEIGKVLTDAQKAKLKEMQGPEFKRDDN